MTTTNSTSPPTAGRQTDGRTLGGGSIRQLPNEAFFAAFEYSAEKLSSGVNTEKPYYCYTGASVVIKGECDPGPVARALARENLHPILTEDGRAMASLWVNVIGDSVIGGYHELALSFDTATRPDVRAAASGTGPHSLVYNYLGGECLNFIHTLWINSPLSIMWGREMQAFPKHPKPVQSRIEVGPREARFSAAWDGRTILDGKVHLPNPWLNLAPQMLGVAAACGPLRLLRFAASSVVSFTTVLPRSVRRRYGVTCAHQGHLFKGLSPAGVLVYPWKEGDILTLGTGLQDFAVDGLESPTDLLVAASFQPRVITCLPRLQLVVTDFPAGMPPQCS